MGVSSFSFFLFLYLLVIFETRSDALKRNKIMFALQLANVACADAQKGCIERFFFLFFFSAETTFVTDLWVDFSCLKGVR